MRRIVYLFLLVILFATTSCNSIITLMMVNMGYLTPRYRTTEASLKRFEKKVGFEPEFFAYVKDSVFWQEMLVTLFPYEEVYDASGQRITYDSTHRCPGSAAQFMKHLGEENLTMDRYEDSSIEELLSKLDFAPGKGFELEALGTKYDYVVCIFFHSGLMIKRYVNVLELQSDSVRANPYSRVALIPVCTDANRKVFPTRKAYKRAIYDKLSEE